MSETKQPKWVFNSRIGDCDPIAYGGAFIFEDATGIYCPEMDYIEPASDAEWHMTRGATKLRVYRILLERQPHQEWWWDGLQSIADSTGTPLDELKDMARGSLQQQAMLYDCLIQYHGPCSFDSNPLTMTEDEAYAKYKEMMK